MIKAWVKLWKGIFDYKGVATRKEYWLGAIGNVFFMYLAAIPTALLAKLVQMPLGVFFALFFTVIYLPVISLYVRRARDAGWRSFTTVWLAVFVPVISGIFVGIFPTAPRDENGRIPRGPVNIMGYCMAVGFGLYIYSAVLGVVFFDGNFDVLFGMTMTGLLLIVVLLIIYGIVNRKEVLRFWNGMRDD